jgi:hypothetical protein
VARTVIAVGIARMQTINMGEKSGPCPDCAMPLTREGRCCLCRCCGYSTCL